MTRGRDRLVLNFVEGRLLSGGTTRTLRNEFSHSKDQLGLSCGIAAPVIDLSHQAVALAFP